MGMAAPEPTLNRLRRTLAEIDPSNAPRLHEDAPFCPSAFRGRRGARRRSCLRGAARTRPHGADPSRRRDRLRACARRQQQDARRDALDRDRLRPQRGRLPLRPGSRSLRSAVVAPHRAARAARGRCAVGDGRGAALPRPRQRHRRTHRRRRTSRPYGDAPAGVGGARRRGSRPSHSPSRDAGAERGGDAMACLRGAEPAGSLSTRLAASAPPRSTFSRQEPARTIRPVVRQWDHHERAFQHGGTFRSGSGGSRPTGSSAICIRKLMVD